MSGLQASLQSATIIHEAAGGSASGKIPQRQALRPPNNNHLPTAEQSKDYTAMEPGTQLHGLPGTQHPSMSRNRYPNREPFKEGQPPAEAAS